MNIQDILAKLQAPHEKLPYEVLKAAIADREQIIPELLQLIEWAQGEQDYLWENPDYLGHIYAMYLLAQFREKLAYPLIIEFFSSFDDEDEPTDNLGRILASVCGGDDSLIKGLIENEKAYKYARGEAIGALVSLVTCGEKTREEVLAYFQALFREKIKREPSNHIVWNYLIRHSTALYPEEVYEDIKQVYADKLAESWIISLEHVESQLALGKERVLKRLSGKYSLIDDVIASLKSGIYSFKTEEDEQVSKTLFELTLNTGDLPRDALTKAIALREPVTPRLLKFLESQEEHADEMRGKENLMLHIYALYLLAQFREQRAYPIIVNFFSLPGDISVETTGDVVTEGLHRILASVYDGDDTPLKGLIEDANVNEHVRSAALKSFVVLVVCEKKSRKEIMAYFQSLFKGKLEKPSPPVWTSLVNCSADLYPEEVYEDIQQVYADGLVEGIEIDEVQKNYALGKKKALKKLNTNPQYTLIKETIKEMQNWACFKKQKEAPRFSELRTGPKIGRNDPCSCGSGKKYKKCCGA